MKKNLLINANFSNDLSDFCDYKNLNPAPSDVLKPDFTFNQFAHEKLSEFFVKKTYDIIILPYNLFEGNYFSFTGISVALHIRLTPSWNHQKTPILFIGAESLEELYKVVLNPSILSTSGIFTTKKRSKQDIENQIHWILKNKPVISEDEYKIFLSRINLTPPEFYDNRHSIANEWALLQLDAISEHRVLINHPKLKEIQANLYIKWQILKNGISLLQFNEASTEPFFIKNTKNKRVLLIEDEWDKGWLKLYKTLFGENCHFEYLDIKKGDNESDILNKIDEKLKEEWDLFLLDIRLTDKDYSKERDYHKYTGFEVLKRIIEQNGGNQIIITSASNKQWIYSYGLEIGASEVIVKPDLNSNLELLDLDNLLNEPVKNCFERKVLKEIHYSSNALIHQLSEYLDDEDFGDFFSGIITLLKNGIQVASKITSKNNEELGVIFVTYFKVFEYLGGMMIKYDRGERKDIIKFWNVELKEYYIENGSVFENDYCKNDPGIAQKISGILKQILGYSDSRVINFYHLKEKRRLWIHPNIKKGEEKIKFEKATCINIFRFAVQTIRDFIAKYEKEIR